MLSEFKGHLVGVPETSFLLIAHLERKRERERERERESEKRERKSKSKREREEVS